MVDKRAHQVRQMFASIAPRYDLLNHLLSLSVDKRWRRVTRRRMAPYLTPDSLLLDLCTGTGDLALEMAGLVRVVGCDFCHPMLVEALRKGKKRPAARVWFAEGDALRLPLASQSFEAATVAFGLRNLERYEVGLQEIFRVLKKGGRLAILEFSIPTLPVFRHFYLFYFKRILPRIGSLISGRDGPYSYLPESVDEFPDNHSLAAMLAGIGFLQIEQHSLSAGIATLHIATR